MTEYIERAAVEKFIEDGLNSSDKNKAFGHDAIEIMAEIHYMPAADVAEVRHGRWMVTDGYPHRLYCSVCYKTYAKNVKWVEELDLPVNYCPECGALMDGKEDEHEAG